MSDEINTLQMYIKEREKWKKQEGSLEIGYQIIKDKIRDLYDNLSSVEGKRGNIAVDLGSKVEAIILENPTIGFENSSYLDIYGQIRLESGLNHKDLPIISDELNRDNWLNTIKNLFLVLKEGNQIVGGYEINGVYYSYKELPLFSCPVYIIAESAKFTFDSKSYAKITDNKGNIMKYKDGTLDLEGVVITLDKTEIQYPKKINSFFDSLFSKSDEWGINFALAFGCLFFASEGDQVEELIGLNSSDGIGPFVFYPLSILFGSKFIKKFIPIVNEYDKDSQERMKACTSMFNIDFFGYIPFKNK